MLDDRHRALEAETLDDADLLVVGELGEYVGEVLVVHRRDDLLES